MNSVPPAVSPHTADKLRGSRRWSRRSRKATSRTPGVKGIRPPQGSKSGFVPDTAPESSTVPDRGRRTPSKRSKPSEPAASVQPEVPDNLLEVLDGTSIDEEHRTIMSTVIQKVQSAKSGLSEACASLLTGFEVSKKYVKI